MEDTRTCWIASFDRMVHADADYKWYVTSYRLERLHLAKIGVENRAAASC